MNDDSVQKISVAQEEEDSGRKRTLTGFWAHLVTVLAAGTTLFHIAALTIFPVDPWCFLATSVGLFCILTFILFPMLPSGKNHVQIIDIVLSLIAVAMLVYLYTNSEDMYYRVGFAPTLGDCLFGLGAVVLVLEMCRRLMGMFLPGICLVFLAYVFFGADLPGIWGHRGYSVARVLSTLSSLDGIYGSAMAAAATYIILFVTFGAFLQKLGVGDLFINLSMAAAGSSRGGPAKMAVFASALLGMISGSSTGNVVTTGAFTIPLMKHVGFRPSIAGSVEAAASTGGQLMPPVMGAAAFVLAEATMTPYPQVCMAALLPAVLYFASIFFMVHLEAINEGLEGLPKSELPNFWSVLKSDWILLTPVAILIYAIVGSGLSVLLAAVLSIISAIIVSAIHRRSFMPPKDFLNALKEGTLGALQPSAACATAGIIIGIFTMTGLGQRLVVLILSYGGSSLLLCLLLIMVITLVLGTGLPTVPAYILTAAVGAPVLAQMGVPVLAAHMFVMYYATISTVTPPVAMAAYAAAGIAKANPTETGWAAFKMSFAAFIIPFMFVYDPHLMMQGTWYEQLGAVIIALLTAYTLALFIKGKCLLPVRAALAAAIVMLIYPSWILGGVAFVVLAICLFIEKKFHARKTQAS